MYLQHPADPTVDKLRYFGPDAKPLNEAVLSGAEDVTGANQRSDTSKKGVKPSLASSEETFSEIRQRLSTLSLNTGYHKDLQAPLISPPFQRDLKKLPPRRISSISSRDTYERRNEGFSLTKPRLNSRSSFLSDDKEIRRAKKSLSLPRNRASETDALNKLNVNILTPGQNPELFSRQIKSRDKPSERSTGVSNSSRCSSPKSVRSSDSSGKIHLGLIESLDLNEKLHDLEKIKERYSNNAFMNSLMLYKLRGHDKCFRCSGFTEHIPRGTRLHSPEPMRTSSKYSQAADSAYAINSIVSPRLSDKLLPHLRQRKDWEPEKSHVHNQIELRQNPAAIKASGRKTPRKRKKSVGFDMEPKHLNPSDSIDSLTTPRQDSTSTEKELRSILKRTDIQKVEIDVNKHEEKNYDDEFVVNESYLWKYHLPKIQSPVHSKRGRVPMSFRRKMYQFGDGVSNEFEQVISKYGNCRQGSWIRDHSIVRDHSFTSQA